jgi:hypothetical protein
MQITTIGLDIAKNVFQVHGIDAAEKVAVRKQLRRSQVLAFFKALPPCLVGLEAAHRLGVAGQGWHLSGACACGGGIVKESGDGRMRLCLCVHELQG